MCHWGGESHLSARGGAPHLLQADNYPQEWSSLGDQEQVRENWNQGELRPAKMVLGTERGKLVFSTLLESVEKLIKVST